MVDVKYYTLGEVAMRNGKNGSPVWVIIRNNIYDLTPYLKDHPGGGDLIEDWAGKDGTKVFNDFGHSGDASKIMKNYKIGQLVEEDRMANRDRMYKKLPDEKLHSEINKKKRLILKFFICR